MAGRFWPIRKHHIHQPTWMKILVLSSHDPEDLAHGIGIVAHHISVCGRTTAPRRDGTDSRRKTHDTVLFLRPEQDRNL